MANSSMVMIAMVTHVAPESFLVEKLEEAVKGYLEAKLLNKPESELKELFEKLAPYCMMILTKIQGDDPMKMMDEMNKIESARKLIEPEKG